MHKLMLFITRVQSEGIVNTGLISATKQYINESFKGDLPRLCLRQYLDTYCGCYGDNSFVESDNSSLKRDTCGPKANNMLHHALDATVTHTDKRFRTLQMNANKQLLKTSLTSKTVSPEFQELSKNVIHLAANQLEQQWKSSHNFDCIEGKYFYSSYASNHV